MSKTQEEPVFNLHLGIPTEICHLRGTEPHSPGEATQHGTRWVAREISPQTDFPLDDWPGHPRSAGQTVKKAVRGNGGRGRYKLKFLSGDKATVRATRGMWYRSACKPAQESKYLQPCRRPIHLPPVPAPCIFKGGGIVFKRRSV